VVVIHYHSSNHDQVSLQPLSPFELRALTRHQ
jgi:hypothetical protein